ncbi:MAG: class I SAM-dependent methyltransferase [Oscillibacter sp.]|nr:class I SAM-dependent methyltransferase [Oscillibacter sp.]
MNHVNQTLYIPLYGKAYVSRKGILLADEKAEEIWKKTGFPLKGTAKSKWLAYYMGMRAAVFDDWLRQQMADTEDAVVIHIGCGMDSRVLRVGSSDHKWYDVDFPDVIRERKLYYQESANYRMIEGDVRDCICLKHIPETTRAIVVMEGVSMYMTTAELASLITTLNARFERIALLMDCYTVFAAKMSKYKNPIHAVGVAEVYGLDDPMLLEHADFKFKKEHSMTPQHLINQLGGLEKFIFKHLYAGKQSGKLYRLFEYRGTAHKP